jgi:hypothetical protein
MSGIGEGNQELLDGEEVSGMVVSGISFEAPGGRARLGSDMDRGQVMCPLE